MANTKLDRKPAELAAVKKEPVKKKLFRISQTECPQNTLEDALKIPRVIKEQFAGQATDPLLLADACGYSPSSSTWRVLTGSSIAYGLTEGGYNSKAIKITSLGERIVSPLIEGDDRAAILQASMIPTILNTFFTQYDHNKFPREDIAKNVLAAKGVPPERIEGVYNIIRANGRFANTIKILNGSEYVMAAPGVAATADATAAAAVQPPQEPAAQDDLPQELVDKMHLGDRSDTPAPGAVSPAVPRVYISHGRESRTIVSQLKELLSYGQMEPVVSVENETTAISVPEKVFDDMRSCTCCIIHICPEAAADADNHTCRKLNENVLIEIGAAMALYGKRIIILCQKGTQLPSNLQGLYRCEYEADQLDYASTMKLLKTLQELRRLL